MQIWPWWRNDAQRGQPHRLLDVGVVEDEQRRVAAELEVRALEVAARELADPTGRPRSSR